VKTGNDASDGFAYLIFGLKSYSDKKFLEITMSLRRAMNELAFQLGVKFPKTMREFLQFCHQPLKHWYPVAIADFDMSQPLLYENALSEEAREYYLDLMDEWEIDPATEINQDILDNARMKTLRQELLNMPEHDKAQAIYSMVRGFLIEASWASLDDLRDRDEIFDYLKPFYEDIPLSLKELKDCPRCGLLRWQNNRWQGIKPSYCDEHGPNASLLSIANKGQLYRLKPIVHERVFLPGQLEKALFNLAESLPVVKAEVYPGIDAYDLRLSFADGEVWAIDAKDQANPIRLGRGIEMPFAEGTLSYSHAFYVLPDERMEDEDYRESLEHNRKVKAKNLFVLSFTEFKEAIETKLEKLAKPKRKRKGE
jgi:hypothetical protein